MQERWAAVDRYITDLFVRPDPALDAALAASDAAGLPAINVAPNHGKLLHLLARACGAARILEIGTLGAYSTIWLARALKPGGHLISLEIDLHHAEVARRNLARAGMSDRVEVRVGRALEALPGLVVDEPFDLIFIDADKPSTADYFRWALKLSRPGTVIVVDNVVRDGRLVDANGDGDVQGMRRFLEAAANEARVEGTVLQTVGVKGYDGFALLLVV